LGLTTESDPDSKAMMPREREVNMTGYSYAGDRHYTRLAERVLEYAKDNCDDGVWDEILTGGWTAEVIAFELERAGFGSLPMALAMFRKIGKLSMAA
tara:strand:- start:2404 stop:2694 length:291 start_codon:yes stop_codon:yes gene_type:complete